MEEKKCKKCPQMLPKNYKYTCCERCRGKSAELAKKVGIGALGVVGLIGTLGIAVFSLFGNKNNDADA